MELPRLQPLYEQYHDQGFEIVAIEYRRDTDRATTFIDENKLTFTFLENGEDDAEVVRSTFQVQGFPTSYLVDRDGRILYYHLGFDEGDEVKLSHQIESVLGG